MRVSRRALRAPQHQTGPPWHTFTAEGALQIDLGAYEPLPIPIHIVHPAGRYLPPKVRLLIDRAVATLRGEFGDEAR